MMSAAVGTISAAHVAHGWYCEADAPGCATHVRHMDLAAAMAGTEDIGEPDGRGGVRQRLRTGARALCACSCGGLLRRRIVAPVPHE